jgi:hypothetical protein
MHQNRVLTQSGGWLDDPRTESAVATPGPRESGCLSCPGVASAGGESRRPQGRSAAPSVGVEPHGARSGAHRAPVAPRPATRVPPGPASGSRRPCARSCPLLPTGCGGRGDTGPGDEGRAHQPLPTDRTAGWLFLSPACALAWRIPPRGARYRLLADLLPAVGQRCALGVGLQAPAAYPHGVARRPMQQPPPDELLEGQAHRPLRRLALRALGPLFIPKDYLLALTRD